MIREFLIKARDARWMWDLFGPIYNRQIYHALAELYEHVALEIDREAPGEVLDVGTGPGHMTLMLAARRPESTCFGIDFSATQVRAAERMRRRKGLRNCRFEQADAMHLPFAANRFDAVATLGSIKHWPDPQRGVAEIHRVLAPDRWAMIAETDREASEPSLKDFMRRFTAWFLWDPLLYWGLRQIIFGSSFSEEEIVAFARNAGFREVRTERLAGCPYVIVKARK